MAIKSKPQQGKPRTSSKVVWPVLSFGVLLGMVFIFYNIGIKPPDVDDRLCPLNGPIATTVFLLDTSDPLTIKHEEKLRKVVSDAISQEGRLAILPESRIVVYELTESPQGIPKLLLDICRPSKDLEDRTWKDDIHQGKAIATQTWKRFNESIASAFPISSDSTLRFSPILETIGVIATKHVPGKFLKNHHQVNLVIFSDLLQHTDRFSHYGIYSDAKGFYNRYPDLGVDLEGGTVFLYRLERSKYVEWQTVNHYYWWTEWIREMDGITVLQERI